MRLERASGILLHPTSLPNGVLDEHAYRFVDWLAAAGQRWWQVLPLGPTDDFGSPYTSPSAFAGSPALLARPRARVSVAERAAFRARNAYWVDDWVDFGGSLDDQVRFDREWSALRAYARRARRPHLRRRADLRRVGRRRPSGASAALPARCRRRCPARPLHAHRAALGQPGLRLAGAARGGLSLVGRAFPADVRARRPRAPRPLPRVRRVLGGSGAAQDGRARPLATRAGTRIVRGGRRRSSATCPSSPRTSA